MLLATDLDGTFLGGDDHYRTELYNLIKNEPDLTLVFVTGRGLENVLPLLKDPAIPKPHFVICDVGSTVLYGDTLKAVEPLQNKITAQWPGSAAIHQALKAMPQLEYQPVPQQRRCSFFLKDISLLPQVEEIVNSLGCDILYSANKFLDILPKDVNKGSTLTNLVQHLAIDESQVLVAGDTLNDLSMYKCGFKGVVVGEAEEKLTKATVDIENVYHAVNPGAGGILEAMRFFEPFSRELVLS